MKKHTMSKWSSPSFKYVCVYIYIFNCFFLLHSILDLLLSYEKIDKVKIWKWIFCFHMRKLTEFKFENEGPNHIMDGQMLLVIHRNFYRLSPKRDLQVSFRISILDHLHLLPKTQSSHLLRTMIVNDSCISHRWLRISFLFICNRLKLCRMRFVRPFYSFFLYCLWRFWIILVTSLDIF